MDLRCPSRKHAVVTVPASNAGEIEIACASRWCGKRAGVVVLHTFSTRTGQLLRSRSFREPKRITEGS